MKTCPTFLLILAVGGLSPTLFSAQQPAAHVLHGTVTAAGAPVRGDGDASVSHRAHGAIEQRDRWLTRIFVRDRGRLVPIAAYDIERLEADDDYVAVVSRGRRYPVYLGMNEFEARLDPERFRRIHRSHVVNLDHVASLAPAEGMRFEIVMRDGSKILASRTVGGPPFPRSTGPPVHRYPGGIFWLVRKRFVGSYCCFTATSRANFSGLNDARTRSGLSPAPM
jgi:hypothetical protein